MNDLLIRLNKIIVILVTIQMFLQLKLIQFELPVFAEMMGKRSWVFIAVAALMVAICYANAIGPNSIDVDEKVIKKESKPM